MIGVTARFYPTDPHYTDFIGGEPYLTLANKYLHEGRKATIEPALLKDRPYLGGVGAPDVTGGQAIVDSSKADLSAEAARYEIQETAHALGHIYQGDIVAPKGAIYVNYYTVDEIAEGSARLLKADGTHSWMQLADLWERIEAGDYVLNPVTPRTPFEQEMDAYEKALVMGQGITVPEFDEFNAADFNSLLDQGGVSTGHRGVQKLDANGDPLHIGQSVRHVDGGDTAWFGKVVNFEAVPHDPAVWAVIVDAYSPTGNKLGKRVVESYYLAPNPNPGWGYTDADGNFQEPALEPPEAEWEVTWPGETDPNAPLTRGPQPTELVPTRAPLPDGWSEVVVNNQTLYVDQRGAMLDPTITEDIPLEMFQNFFAVTKGYVDSKPPGWKLKPREDGDKGNLAYLAPDGTTWVVWIPGDDATH